MSGGDGGENDKGIEKQNNRVGGNGTTVRNDGPHNAENGPTKVTSGSAATTTVTEDSDNSKPSSKIEYKVKSEYADGYQKLTRNMEIAVESRRISEVEGSWGSRRSSEDRGIHAFMQSAVVISSGVTCKDRPAENDVDQFADNALQQHVPKKRKTKVKRAKSMEVFYRGRDFDLSDTDTESCASSLESLIKHNLAGAKALQPVPVAKAKERNYLHGRSGTDSLLGKAELERIFPKRDVTIFIATWNMNGEEPPSNLNELFLNDLMDNLADIFVIGTQESYSETTEWLIGIQETIGPTHVLFHSETLGTICLAVFIRRELIWYCSVPEDDSHSVRPGSAFKTKGAVGICFYLFGSSFLFITSHLTAHDDKLQERINDVAKIMKSLELPKQLPVSRRPLRAKTPNVIHNFDYVFWFGDLNFRVTQPREQVIEWVSKQKFPLSSSIPFPFYDQLQSSMKKGLVFRGFLEAPITFPPSYKYDPGSQQFDTSHKKRTPSYTDRILFKSRKSSRSILTPLTNYTYIKPTIYTSAPSVCTSDHKPVWGLFQCKLRPGIDTVPLAAGFFNREVYLDALKKRAAQKRSRLSLSDSRSCAIQ